jgi:hypothetical protein
VSSSFLLKVFFSGGLPFAHAWLGLELLSSSLFEEIIHESSPLVWPTGTVSGYLDCCLIGVVVRPFNPSFETLGLH